MTDKAKLKFRYLRAKEAILRRELYSPAKARYWAKVAWDRVKRETRGTTTD